MNIPKYPDDFFDFTNGVNITDEEINQWIQEGINSMEYDRDRDHWDISTGNARVDITRYIYNENSDKYYYIIRVSKSYAEADISEEA